MNLERSEETKISWEKPLGLDVHFDSEEASLSLRVPLGLSHLLYLYEG